jgi:hypothetical protein
MKFIIDTYKDVWQYFWQQKLIYIPEEYSFYMDSIVSKIDIELTLNTISLVVSGGIVVNVNGFCGFSKSMISNYQVPEFKKGILRVEYDLKHGFTYGISDNEHFIYINTQTGWVCMGNPRKNGNGVEFINNCVAIINDDKEFVALWLKPQKLPDI